MSYWDIQSVMVAFYGLKYWEMICLVISPTLTLYQWSSADEPLILQGILTQ